MNLIWYVSNILCSHIYVPGWLYYVYKSLLLLLMYIFILNSILCNGITHIMWSAIAYNLIVTLDTKVVLVIDIYVYIVGLSANLKPSKVDRYHLKLI